MIAWLETLTNTGTPVFALCGLPFILGAAFGASFTGARFQRSAKDRRWIVGRPLTYLLTTGGALALNAWNVKNAGPISGFFWVAGFLVGGAVVGRMTLEACISAGSQMSAHEVSDLRGYARSILYETGLREARELVMKRIEQVERRRQNDDKALAERYQRACAELHDFIHEARDGAINCVRAYRSELETFLRDKDLARLLKHNSAHRDDYLRKVLQEMLEIFSPLVREKAPLWIAIRVIDKIERMNVYRTMVRVGAYNKSRGETSETLAEDSQFPKHMKRQHRLHKPIVILNGKRSKRSWGGSTNDKLGEDRSCMAGPIFIKTVQPAPMAMILYVNSPQQDAFDDRLAPIMKCCTDVLSMFFTLAAEFDDAMQTMQPITPD